MVRAIPEPVKAVDGKLVISLLLQPDDSAEAMQAPYHTVDLDHWPAEIFGRLQDSRIYFRTSNPAVTIQADIKDWIPRPVDAGSRNDLWVKAVGAGVLRAAAGSSPGLFVEDMEASIAARRAPTKHRVFHAPLRNLATSMNALTATSVLSQLGAQALDNDALLSSKANPLAPSTQQSLALFDVFEGTRPESRSDNRDVPQGLRELFSGDSSDAKATLDILRRVETYGRIKPDAANRIDAIFEDAQSARSRGREEPPAVDKHLGRIPPDLQEAIFKRVKAATPVADRTGKLSLAAEFDNVLTDDQYFETAVRGFLGKPIRGVTLRENGPQIIDDYAAYLLAMQADDPALADRKLENAHYLENDPQTALRVISGLYSYPQLAAFFGLLVDVEIDVAELPEDTALIAAELGQTPGGWSINAPVWTAISVSGTPEDRRIEVRPRNKQAPLAQCADGLLRMGDARVGSVHRFDILSLDVNAAVDGMFTASRNDQQSLLDGALREDLSSTLPSQKGPALVIADRAKNLEAGYELTESAEHIEGNALRDAKARVLYLEDVSVGYRIDVSTSDSAPFGSGKSMQRAADFFADDAWLSLMDREVHFSEIEKALKDEGHDPGLLNQSPSWGVDRMAGSIRSVFREIQSDASQQMVVAYDTLASWSGWSLAVPMLGDSVDIKPGEIGLRRTIAPLVGSLPAMRYGSGVAFAARCTLANGSSITRQAAMELYNNWSDRQKFVLHRGPGVPDQLTWNSYPVLRHEPLATPRIHHRAHDVKGEKAETPNREIVVSAASGDRKTAYRVVLPGIATLDESERHGVLDGFDELPPPPFVHLPIFPKPGAAFVDPTVGADPDKDPESAERVPSYPDPAVRYLSLAFTEDGVPAEKFGYAPPVAVDLYAEGARSWPNAGAIGLEIAAVNDGYLPLHDRIAGRFDMSGAMPGKSGMGRTRIYLAPAEQIDLTIWSLPAMLFDYTRFAPFAATARLASFGFVKSHGLIPEEGPATEMLGAIGNGSLNKAVERSMGVISEGSDAVDILQRSLRKLPVPALSNYETVRLIHAVERPLVAPRLDNLFVLHNAPVDSSASGGRDNEEKIRQAWVAALASWELDEHERPRDGDPAKAFGNARNDYSKGSNRIFVGGSVGLHRKSTGRIDFVGSWRDYSDEIAPRLDRETNRYEYKPRDRVEILASREGIPYRAQSDDPDRIGIALDEQGDETFAGYTFGDTRARRLRVAARAISRFKSHFEVRDGEVDQFALDSEWREEIVLSTERPKPLAAPFCEPSLHYELEAYSVIPEDDQALLSGQRHRGTVKLRYDLGDRHYVTGVDERVGVVCWPPNLFDAPQIEDVYAMKVSEVDKEILKAIDTHGGGEVPKGAADYVTRWGRDPISESGALPALIPASAFRNAVKAVTTTLPLPAAKKPGEANTGLEPPALSSATINVSLALFDPQLDPATGRFYVDIEIDQNESYEPWVRLGLVRYQEHSVTGLHCSLPVKSMARIPADRQLEVEIDSDRRLSLRYSGLGHGRKVVPSGLAQEPQASLFARPLLDVTVLRTRDVSVSGAPAIVKNDEFTGLAHVTGLPPRVDDGELEWVLGRFMSDGTLTNDASRELVLPMDCGLGEISILVTEREHFAADDYRLSFGSSRTTESTFEEPLAWNDTIEVAAFPGTVVTSRIISAVHLRLITAETCSDS